MPATWTKAEEIAHYTRFVASLPAESYLRAILKGSEDYVAGEISNDFARPMAGELRELQHRAYAVADELKAARAKVAEAENQLRHLTNAQNRAREWMAEAANNARTAAAMLAKS